MPKRGAKVPADPNSAEERLRARLRRWLLYFERESEDLKRYELAEHMGISPPHFSNLVNGKAKIGIDAFVKMAKFGKALEHMALFEPPKPGESVTDSHAQDERRTAKKRAHGLKSSL